MNPPVDIDKIKKVVDTLVRGKVIDLIMQTMDHGFGEVHFKVTVQNGSIKVISLTDTKTVKIDEMR